MSDLGIPNMHAGGDSIDGLDEEITICTVSVRIDIPEHIAQRAHEIARQSDDPEKEVGDFLDEACMLDITYCVAGQPIKAEPDG